MEGALKEVGDLQGKVLINCTNRFDGKSADEEVRRHTRNARIVRAYHTLPWEVMDNPDFDGTNATVFLYGDNDEAVTTVARLTADIGLDPLDAGDSARMEKLEAAVGLLWGALTPQFGRDFSLRILRR